LNVTTYRRIIFFFLVLLILFSFFICLAPGEVKQLKSRPSNDSVLITWSPPDVNPQCVSSYQLNWNLTEESTYTLDTNFYISNLIPCTELLVTVTALSEIEQLNVVQRSAANITASTSAVGESTKFPPFSALPNLKNFYLRLRTGSYSLHQRFFRQRVQAQHNLASSRSWLLHIWLLREHLRTSNSIYFTILIIQLASFQLFFL